MATSASTVGLPEDKAYIAHHFNCPTCCAAGLSGGKQQRCPDGLRLWNLYMRAFQVHLRKDPNHDRIDHTYSSKNLQNQQGR